MQYQIAIVLTACGIETSSSHISMGKRLQIAIVLTACGIETCLKFSYLDLFLFFKIAIVLTACGIETQQ